MCIFEEKIGDVMLEQLQDIVFAVSNYLHILDVFFPVSTCVSDYSFQM